MSISCTLLSCRLIIWDSEGCASSTASSALLLLLLLPPVSKLWWECCRRSVYRVEHALSLELELDDFSFVCKASAGESHYGGLYCISESGREAVRGCVPAWD